VRATYSELSETRIRLNANQHIGPALDLPWPRLAHTAEAKFRSWAKKINAEREIQELHRSLAPPRAAKVGAGPLKKKEAFLGVTVISEAAEPEAYFSTLPLNEVDFDEEMHSWLRLLR
jgi:hypothetical protein